MPIPTPSRETKPVTIQVPEFKDFASKIEKKTVGKEISTTMGFVRLLEDLLRDNLVKREQIRRAQEDAVRRAVNATADSREPSPSGD